MDLRVIMKGVSGCSDCPALYDEVTDYISTTSACCGLVKDEPAPTWPSSGFRTLPSDNLQAPSVAPDWCPLRVHSVLLVLKDGA